MYGLETKFNFGICVVFCALLHVHHCAELVCVSTYIRIMHWTGLVFYFSSRNWGSLGVRFHHLYMLNANKRAVPCTVRVRCWVTQRRRTYEQVASPPHLICVGRRPTCGSVRMLGDSNCRNPRWAGNTIHVDMYNKEKMSKLCYVWCHLNLCKTFLYFSVLLIDILTHFLRLKV